MAEDDIEIISSLPIEALVAAPVISAARAQTMLCREFAEFIRTVGTDKEGNLRVLPFNFQVPSTGEDGKLTGDTTACYINAPFIALTGVPNFAIEELNVEFNVKVENMEQTDLEAHHSPGKGQQAAASGVVISGSVAQGEKQTRKTDTNAQYQFKLLAKKQPPSEAVMRVLDILTETMIKIGEPEQE